MYVHVALYRWKPSAKPHEVQVALADIASLASKIPGIIEISCARNTSKYSEGYTHVILVRAKDEAALNAYRAHPIHEIAAQRIGAMEEHGIGVDFSLENTIE